MFNKLHQLVLHESQVPYHNPEIQLYAYINTSFFTHNYIIYFIIYTSFLTSFYSIFILYNYINVWSAWNIHMTNGPLDLLTTGHLDQCIYKLHATLDQWIYKPLDPQTSGFINYSTPRISGFINLLTPDQWIYQLLDRWKLY